MRDIAQKGSFGAASRPKDSELGSSANGAVRILNSKPQPLNSSWKFYGSQ